MNGISVVICAHNSAERIRPTIEALARCRSDFPVEIIVVDNNSTDGTASRATEAWKASANVRFDFCIVREPQAGLAYARRAGTRAASRDIIVFCDDDNWLGEDYLIQAMRIMADPSVGAAGGCSTPTRPERLPPWFYTFSWGYAVGVPIGKIESLPQFPTTERPVSSLWGAGLVVRRDALDFLFSLPEFPALAGRKSAALLSGDDLEISTCLACAGYKLLFSEALRFEHDIAPERLDPDYARQLFRNFGVGFAATGRYHKIIEAFENPLRATVAGIARVMKHALIGRLSRDTFLSLFAALRLEPLLTDDQRRIYDTVKRIRGRFRKRGVSARRAFIAKTSRKPSVGAPPRTVDESR